MRDRNSITFKMNMIFIVTLVILMIVQTSMYFWFSLNIMHQKQSNNENMVNYIVDKIGEKIVVLEHTQKSLGYFDCIKDYLRSDDLEDKSKKRTDIVDMIVNVQKINIENVYILIADKEGNIQNFVNNITTDEKDKIERLFEKRKNINNGQRSVDYDIFSISSQDSDSFYIASFSPVYVTDYVDIMPKNVGTSIVFIKVSSNSLVREIKDKENFDISILPDKTQNEKITLCNNANKSGKIIVSERTVDNTSWAVRGSTYWNIFNDSLGYIYRFILFEAIFVGILILIMQWILNNYLTKPIRKIEQYVLEYQLSKKYEYFELDGATEINNIVSYINLLTKNLKEMMHRIFNSQQKFYEMELCEQKAVLDSLQLQMNPHFIYNSLESVRSIALYHGISEIETIVVSISEILRYSINASDYVTIKQEMDIIKEYIKIMEIRFPDVFKINIDIEEKLYQNKIPKMLFQPIVENAFTHGFVSGGNNDMLNITGKLVGDDVVFTFHDNGVGMKEEALNNLISMLNTNEICKECLGLSNINKRIKLCYGKEYGIIIKSEYKKYTEIVLTFPKNKNM